MRRHNPYRRFYADWQNDIADVIVVVFAVCVIVAISCGWLS